MVERILLSDGSGRWFDAAKAQKWEGAQDEILYQSVCLLWVLRHAESARDAETIAEIEDQAAIAWLKRNGHPLPAASLCEALRTEAGLPRPS